MVSIRFQVVKTGEILLVRSVSPNPFPRTFSIGLNHGFSKEKP
jgi:hypothetical protein